MKAVILAGGQGKRLYPLTKDIPKCLIRVGDKTILEMLLDNLSINGIKEIVIVTGFCSDKVKKIAGENYNGSRIIYADNIDFDKNNTAGGISAAESYVCGEEFLQIHGDLILDTSIIDSALNSEEKDAILIDSFKGSHISDGNKVKITNGFVSDINKTMPVEISCGRAFGVYKFSKEASKIYFEEIKKSLKNNFSEVFETPLRKIFEKVHFGIIDIKGNEYYEIDDLADLEAAKESNPALIKNYYLITQNKQRKDALNIALDGIKSVMPSHIIKDIIRFENDELYVYNDKYPLNGGRIYVIGGGKASGAMAKEIEKIIPLDKIKFGYVNSIKEYDTKKIIVNEAGHPIPDERSVSGTEKMLEISGSLNENDLVICLISGGGSALITKPVEGISLDDLKIMSEKILKCGAYAFEHSTIRKCLDEVKGGKLAKKMFPARIVSLILSDELVKPNTLDEMEVASRPTAYDNSNFEDAYNVIKKYQLEEKIPSNIIKYIKNGIANDSEACVKRGSPLLKNVKNYLIADYKIALKAMKEKAEDLGYNAELITEAVVGEISQVTGEIAEKINRIQKENKKTALIFSSETSVHVKEGGKGGRSQELSARMIDIIKSKDPSAFVSIGTDGVDFISGVGGGVVDNSTYKLVEKMGLSILENVEKSRSYYLHEKLGSLIKMNPTGTHIGDIGVFIKS